MSDNSLVASAGFSATKKVADASVQATALIDPADGQAQRPMTEATGQLLCRLTAHLVRLMSARMDDMCPPEASELLNQG